MSRPLRIEYPDAWYHVMNRGCRGDKIFLDDTDYQLFLKSLEEAVDLWQVHICGYCLMPNHYHLLMQTPEANLSRCMRHINGVYTQRFNRHHRLDGPLFRGRFKSILIGEDHYLIELLRYICFNPVKAGLVSKPEAYPWSCYQDYLSNVQQHHWLNRDLIVEKFQLKKDKGIYQEEILSQDAKEDIYQFFTKKNLPSLLGTKEFSDQIKHRFFENLIHPEKPASKQLARESKTMIELVCRRFGLAEKEVLRQKRGVSNIPRDLAIYLVRKRSLCKLEEIAELFQYSNYSGVSTALERITRQLQTDADLAKIVKKLEQQLTKKSQKKT